MFKKFKQKWNINSNWQLTIILIVFSLTGTASMFVRKIIFEWIGVTSETSLWLKAPLYILVLIPTYHVLLIIIGSLFGQFRFFFEFQKKHFSRYRRRKELTKAINETDEIIIRTKKDYIK